MTPTPEALQRAAAAFRSAADAAARAERSTGRAFAASHWQGPAARRFDRARAEQGHRIATGARSLRALADEMERDTRELRHALLVAGVTASAGGRS